MMQPTGVALHLGLGELGPAGVVVEVADDEGEVGVARLADRLAVVHRLEHGEQPVVLVDAARHRVQVARAHVAGQAAPCRVRVLGCSHLQSGVLWVGE